MNIEIERKFLICGDFKAFAYKEERITQAYISVDPKRNVRVRLKGEQAYITIKGETSADGTSRIEWENELGLADAQLLLTLCDPHSMIEKTRYCIQCGDRMFEVDEFHGRNQGLIVAEIELQSKDEAFDKPDWLGEEVTGDAKYYNSQLSQHPYAEWHINL